MKFKSYRKGTITQRFDDNANPMYKNAGLGGHTGVDWQKEYGAPVLCDNAGHVYKVWNEGQAKSGWTAVCMLSPIGGDYFMEIQYGHLSKIFVSEGENIPEDMLIGQEGNKGDVYSGGKYYPEGHPDKGTKGSHVHEQYRIVKKTPQMRAGKHYLNNRDGSRYQDEQNNYYEVLITNDVNGCVDPFIWEVPEPPKETRIAKLVAAMRYWVTRKMV